MSARVKQLVLFTLLLLVFLPAFGYFYYFIYMWGVRAGTFLLTLQCMFLI